MSHFCTALATTLEELPYKRSTLAKHAGIPASTLHGLVHGTTRPDVETLEKLCQVLDQQMRVRLVIAHLRDETPDSARDLVRVVSLLEEPRIAELPEPEMPLPPSVLEDFRFLMQLAVKHPEVGASIRSTARLLRGR